MDWQAVQADLIMQTSYQITPTKQENSHMKNTNCPANESGTHQPSMDRPTPVKNNTWSGTIVGEAAKTFVKAFVRN
jgi:hypothetical protein